MIALPTPSLRPKTVLALSLAVLAAPALAKDKDENAAKMLDRLQECQTIAEPTQRLACYDSRIVPLKEARAKDRNFLGKAPREKFQTITATARSVAELQPGTWLLVLSDNSVWRTDDDVRFFPKAGDTVIVTTAALGSYKAKIGKQHEVRVKPMH